MKGKTEKKKTRNNSKKKLESTQDNSTNSQPK